MRRVLLDTNVYIDWLNHGSHERLVVGAGYVRHMSAIVSLHAGAGIVSVP
ncbi:MAG TPA: hypothetical protein VEB21_11690 [Terriglobales bacterium]|nr:hypothetical protein [Terriglobales bacterium]